ncbi:uncharacterized protein PG986_004425 [Apiospora aurea]|uniref:Uncharacterized protein n=1 Tax=Apiospora aurea TaxID=335848 RepID=A0ABR1QMJ9_9PEZI
MLRWSALLLGHSTRDAPSRAYLIPSPCDHKPSEELLRFPPVNDGVLRCIEGASMKIGPGMSRSDETSDPYLAGTASARAGGSRLDYPLWPYERFQASE